MISESLARQIRDALSHYTFVVGPARVIQTEMHGDNNQGNLDWIRTCGQYSSKFARHVTHDRLR